MTGGRLALASLAVLAASVLRPTVARAQNYDDYFGRPPPPPPLEVHPAPPAAAPFGSRGQWVVSGASSLGASWESFSNSSAVYTSATFNPGVDWFPVRNVSLGLKAGVSYSDDKGYGADGSLVDIRRASVRVGPRIGVNLPLGSRLSIWPRAAAGFEWMRDTVSVESGPSASVASSPLGVPTSTAAGLWVAADVAVLYHLTPHLFIGVVPAVHHGFGSVQESTAGGQETELSVGFVVGGWFGGPPPPVEPEAPDVPPPPVRRFGQAGEFVLSNELVLGGHSTSYAGTSSSSSSGGLTAGIDHFLANHVSLGAAFTWSGGTTTGIDPTTHAAVTNSASGGAISVRAGVDVPLGTALSFWPRAFLAFGEAGGTEVEGTTNHHDDKIISVGLYAPVLVHPAPHFFVGFGPSVDHDLMHAEVSKATLSSGTVTYSGSGAQNLGTSLGASFVVGGWL